MLRLAAIEPRRCRFEIMLKAFANGIGKFTPKAFANFSPGFERSENPGLPAMNLNPVRVCLERNPFRVETIFVYLIPGFERSENPGLADDQFETL